MGDKSNIEWTDSTFNPWKECKKIGPGCDNCYAEHRNARYAGGKSINWGLGVPRRRTSKSNWNKPLKWNNQPFYECQDCGWRGGVPMRAEAGSNPQGCCPDCHQTELKAVRRRVFCASLADFFDNEVSQEWRNDLFSLIEQTPNLD